MYGHTWWEFSILGELCWLESLAADVEGIVLLKHPQKRSSITSLTDVFQTYVAILGYYVKARSLVFIFPWATFISLLIATNGHPNPFTAGMVVSASYLIMLAIYTYNDVVDLKVDRINAPNRPLVSGRVSKKGVIRLVSILNGTALLITSMINFYTMATASVLILLGVAYSHPKTSYKDIFPLKTLLTATGAALVSLMGGLAAGNLSPYIIYAATVFFVFESILAPLGDIHDVKGDRAAGRRTFPIVLGLRPTIVMMIMMSALIALVSVIARSLVNINSIGLMMIVAVCGVAVAILTGLLSKYDDRMYTMKIRHRMRFIHVLLQLALFIGMIT